MTRSVFQKACPGCAAVIPADTGVCDCGYNFRTGEPQGDVSAADSTAPGDDELFAAYLSARLEQARAHLDQLRAELAQRPHDHAKATQVMHAIYELRDLKSQCDEQLSQLPAGLEPTLGLSDTPGEAFRSQQAARAAEIMQTTEQALHRTPPPWRAPAPQAGPGDVPRPTGKPNR